jgi:hypothetical protein
VALPRRTRDLVGLGLLLLVVAAGVAYALLTRPGDPRPSDERVLLDATRPVPEEGLLLAFRLEAPGEVEVRVDLPDGAETEVEVGLPSPARGREGTYPPDPAKAWRFPAKGPSSEPWVRPLFAVGNYAVRVRPFAAAGEPPPVRVRVTAR